MDELYNNKLLNELSLMLGDSQKSQSPSMAQPTNNLSIAPTLDLISSLNENISEPTSSGLASMEQPVEEEQISESVVETPNEAPISESGLSQMAQQPKRSEFEITPEMRQISMAIDFLTGSPYGTTIKEISDDYRNITMAQEDRAIGDFERERTYQDARADKERDYATQERKEQRDIEKERRDYIDKRLEGLQGPAFRAATETAKANVANEARNLDPERFAGKSDEEILERLKLGVEPQKKTGKDYDKEAELIKLEYGLKEKLEKIKKETKLAETAAKNEGKMSKPAEKIMQKEADNIGKEADKLQEEHRKVQSLNASYVKNINRLNTFKKDIEKLDELVNTAGHLIGVGIRAKGKNDPKAVKAYQEIRGLMTRVNTGMIEFAKEAGATGKMLDSDKDKETFLGPMAKLDNNIDSIFTTENDVKNTIRTAVKSYEEKLRDYKVLISEMNRNYNDNEDHLNSMKANFDTKYGLNKDKPIKNGTTKTAAGFKITIK